MLDLFIQSGALVTCFSFPLWLANRGEHILLFLVQTVARQSVEHCQYRPPRIREDRNRKAANAEGGWRFTTVVRPGFTSSNTKNLA